MKTKNRVEEKWFKTRDGLNIAANFYSKTNPTLKKGGKGGFGGLNKTLIILAPGFAKYKDGYPMTEMCGHLNRYGDSLCIDFRGVGKSEGRYRFGGSEYLDLEPILQWGRKHYRRTVCVGLSLGSYHCLRAACEWPRLVDKLLLVSCPSKLEDVLMTFGPLRQGFAIATDWKALKKRLGIEFSLFFRWGNPFSKKPNGAELAKRLKVPAFFLVGGKDRLVVKHLSRKIYENASQPKSWTEIRDGNHAEFLYLENQKEFKHWLKVNLNGRNK